MESTEPYLLTPGPLTTSLSVKKAMMYDWGAGTVISGHDIRIAQTSSKDSNNKTGTFECIPIQGSGTYAVEAMLSSLVSPSEKFGSRKWSLRCKSSSDT